MKNIGFPANLQLRTYYLIVNLKQIEISGFKSFGKAVALEFNVPITAIVGPNGSGKSNVSEALRWVLGEQSMKSLRGKRGEDLIFHGSGSAAQLGKASVKITFDNSKKIFPLDFEDVVISRDVYRDGVNEYKLNGSVVRLKDIVELLSNVGIGGSGHYVISQGEADRILYASPKERKNMLEDALGLRIYQIKKAEAERKLDSTEANIKQVEALRREIQPHMRFLKTQAEKVEKGKQLRDELRAVLSEYIARENFSIETEIEKITREEDPYAKEKANIEHEVASLRERMQAEDHTPDPAMAGAVAALDKQMVAATEQRRSLERELGRLEGQRQYLESRRKNAPQVVNVPAVDFEQGLGRILSLVEDLLSGPSLEIVKEKALLLKGETEQFLRTALKRQSGEDSVREEDALRSEEGKMRGLIETLSTEMQGLSVQKQEQESMQRKLRQALWEAERSIRAKEEELYKIKDALQAKDILKERLRLRKEEFLRDRSDIEHLAGEIPPYVEQEQLLGAEERDELRRRMQRLRIKLEEVGGIDASVLSEYEGVSGRDHFLGSELEDLAKSKESLRQLMKELDEHLERDFYAGIDKINKEFAIHFHTMFDGGSAALRVVDIHKHGSEEDNSGSLTSGIADVRLPESEEGIEISVDLPRKRVKNLDMLSGGERALTSIALLFAMSTVNPPPFLVLDETDAALDEANSQRYGAMLRDLSQKTQLVVITHNRQTMKEAGILYGITMGSDGISRLLSLKFDEATAMSGKTHE